MSRSWLRPDATISCPARPPSRTSSLWAIISLTSDELDNLLVKFLDGRNLRNFSLDISFGRTPRKGLELFASRLFKFFPSPFLQTDFNHSCAELYIQNVSLLPIKYTPKKKLAFSSQVTSQFLADKKLFIPKRSSAPCDLAISSRTWPKSSH